MRSHFLSNAPVAMVFAVFKPVMALQKSFSHSNGFDFTAAKGPEKGRRSAPNRNSEKIPQILRELAELTAKKVKTPLGLRKSG